MAATSCILWMLLEYGLAHIDATAFLAALGAIWACWI